MRHVVLALFLLVAAPIAQAAPLPCDFSTVCVRAQDGASCAENGQSYIAISSAMGTSFVASQDCRGPEDYQHLSGQAAGVSFYWYDVYGTASGDGIFVAALLWANNDGTCTFEAAVASQPCPADPPGQPGFWDLLP